MPYGGKRELRPERGGGGGKRIDSIERERGCGKVMRDIKYDTGGCAIICVGGERVETATKKTRTNAA